MNEDRRRSNDRLIDQKFIGVHDAIEGTRELLTVKLDHIIAQTTKTNSTVSNHDNRIDSLENWRWYVIGTCGGVAAVFTVYQVLVHI